MYSDILGQQDSDLLSLVPPALRRSTVESGSPLLKVLLLEEVGKNDPPAAAEHRARFWPASGLTERCLGRRRPDGGCQAGGNYYCRGDHGGYAGTS